MTMEPEPADESITILNRQECWALLRTQEVGRLGIAIANKADIFPLNFVVDHSTVVFRTAEGTKLYAAIRGEAVAFECDGYDPGAGEAWSVVLKGIASEVENMYEFFDALDLPLFPWHGTPKPRFVRIAPTEVTGRRFHVVDKAVWGYKSRQV